VAKSKKYMFEVTKSKIKCGIKTFETKEGLLLTFSNQSDNLVQADNYAKIIQEIMFSDIDWNYYQLLHVFNEINQRLCETTISIIKASSNRRNEFFIIIDSNGNELISFSYGNVVTVPKCIPVESVELRESKECRVGIPIKFKYENGYIKGYLLNDNIVVTSSKKINCSDVEYEPFYTNSMKTLIIRRREKAIIRENYNLTLVTLKPFKLNISYLNNAHSSRILERINILKIHDVTDVNSGDDHKYLSGKKVVINTCMTTVLVIIIFIFTLIILRSSGKFV